MDNSRIRKVHKDGRIVIYYDDVYVGVTYTEASRYYDVATDIKICLQHNTPKSIVDSLVASGCRVQYSPEQDMTWMIRTFYDDECTAIAWWYEAERVIQTMA